MFQKQNNCREQDLTTYLGKSCSFCLPRVPFVIGFEGRIWDLIVSVPDHCLSFYFEPGASRVDRKPASNSTVGLLHRLRNRCKTNKRLLIQGKTTNFLKNKNWIIQIISYEDSLSLRKIIGTGL